VYNYINSKEAFLEGYLFDIIDSFTIYLNQILESSHSPKDKLKYVVSKHVQFTIQEPYQVALFVYDWRNLQEPKLSDFKQKRVNYLKKIGSIIEEGMQVGEFRDMNVEIATYLFFSSLRWLFNILMEDDKQHNPIELEKQLTDFIFCGMGRN
ncbi:MAG: TetR/AcrR family transcriptional regulator C-terminal domain-containing protein, partial [Pricia sp.]